MIWALLLLVAAAGYGLRWAQEELNAERFWILPYRERCRRQVGPLFERWERLQCPNLVWRIRWNAMAPLSVVCRECRRKGAKERVGV